MYNLTLLNLINIYLLLIYVYLYVNYVLLLLLSFNSFRVLKIQYINIFVYYLIIIFISISKASHTAHGTALTFNVYSNIILHKYFPISRERLFVLANVVLLKFNIVIAIVIVVVNMVSWPCSFDCLCSWQHSHYIT